MDDECTQPCSDRPGCRCHQSVVVQLPSQQTPALLEYDCRVTNNHTCSYTLCNHIATLLGNVVSFTWRSLPDTFAVSWQWVSAGSQCCEGACRHHQCWCPRLSAGHCSGGRLPACAHAPGPLSSGRWWAASRRRDTDLRSERTWKLNAVVSVSIMLHTALREWTIHM